MHKATSPSHRMRERAKRFYAWYYTCAAGWLSTPHQSDAKVASAAAAAALPRWSIAADLSTRRDPHIIYLTDGPRLARCTSESYIILMRRFYNKIYNIYMYIRVRACVPWTCVLALNCLSSLRSSQKCVCVCAYICVVFRASLEQWLMLRNQPQLRACWFYFALTVRHICSCLWIYLYFSKNAKESHSFCIYTRAMNIYDARQSRREIFAIKHIKYLSSVAATSSLYLACLIRTYATPSGY